MRPPVLKGDPAAFNERAVNLAVESAQPKDGAPGRGTDGTRRITHLLA